MIRLFAARIVFASAALVLCIPPAAAQFRDNGFLRAKARTDFNATNEGTSANPLTIGSCLYVNNSDPLLLAPGCMPTGSVPTVFSQSHYKAYNNPGIWYWVVSANNELHTSTLNSGAPNLSVPLPIPQPANNVMEFTLLTGSLPGESLWRAHMIVDHTPSGSQNPQGAAGIPFLGIGADRRRGNLTSTGTLQGSSGSFFRTKFKGRIWDKIYTPGGVALMYIYAFTQWPNTSGQQVSRGAFIQLFHQGLDTSSQTQACPNSSGSSSPPCKGLNRHWNWRYNESFFSPGTDFAFIDAEDASWACTGSTATSVTSIPANNTDVTVTVDWEKIFRCMSNNGLFDEPMPTGSLPLIGVHWAVEVSGVNNALWASVHDMRMLTSTGKSGAAKSDEVAIVPADWQDPVTTEQMRIDFWEACLADDECRNANVEQYLEKGS